MENSRASSTRNMSQTGKDMLLPVNPIVCVPTSHVSSISIQSGCLSQPLERYSQHQRCSSESFLEQPSWLEDLLDDSESETPKYHRRSASDPSAYWNKTIHSVLTGSPSSLQTNGNPVDPDHACFNKNSRSSDGTPNKTLDSSLKLVDYTNGLSATNKGTTRQNSGSSCGSQEDRVEKPNQLGSGYQESHGEQGDVLQSMSAPKTDSKRAKKNRQSAHRSRIRKLQYIAELERNVHGLQAEGSGFVAEIEFRNQHNLILSMENRTLRQHVETISQELLIKQMEHEMLQREVQRLQTLFQLQMHRHQHQQEATTPLMLKTAVQKQLNESHQRRIPNPTC